jgi:excisionase family DNA binding protein
MGTTAFLVSIREASRKFNVTRDLLYRLINQGLIPCYRLSPRTLRVDLSELREHMRLTTQTGDQTEGRGDGGAERKVAE